METEKEKQLWHIAKKRVKFKRHLAIYIVINTMLWLMWAFTKNHEEDSWIPWPVFSTIGWGVGVVFSFLGAYVFSKHDAVEREFEKLKAKSN